MPPYRFRLATVERLRESRRDDARLRLAEANQAAELLSTEEWRLRQELAAARQAWAAETASPTPDAGRLTEHQRYETALNAQLSDLAGKQKLVEEEIDRRRQQLAAADRDVRVLRLLDERGRERHRVAEQAAEQRELDEVAAVAWRRRNAVK